MDLTIAWAGEDAPSLEHLRLARQAGGHVADGVIVSLREGAPHRLHYIVVCDDAWRPRGLLVDPLDGNAPLQLTGDGEGHWSDAEGAALDALAGCSDVDLSATPFTNTLPIRRQRLQPGESAEIRAVYVQAPALAVEPARQRYTCLAVEGGRSIYRYEGLDTGFVAEIVVDEHGLVLDYPGLFRRIASP